MVRSLFSFAFIAVASACCFVSAQTPSATVTENTPKSGVRLVLSDTLEAKIGEPKSSGLAQIPEGASASSASVLKPAFALDNSQLESVLQAPAAGETAITATAGTVISTPKTNQVYSFQRDGIPTLQQRRQIRTMPIEYRPHRPFHFYGNSVRRRRGR